MLSIYNLGDEFLVCQPCTKFANGPLVPKALIKQCVGNFGIISRKQAPGSITYNQNRHSNLSLHKWCVAKCKSEIKSAVELQDQNLKAGRKVIFNLLWCLKHSGSAHDFVALNGKIVLGSVNLEVTNTLNCR